VILAKKDHEVDTS